MTYKEDLVDIGLGLTHPSLSPASLENLRMFSPTYDPEVRGNLSIFPRNYPPLCTGSRAPLPIQDAPVLGSAPSVFPGVPSPDLSTCSGVLLRLTYPAYLTLDERARLEDTFSAFFRPYLACEGTADLRISWLLVHYPDRTQMKYRFTWAFNLTVANWALARLSSASRSYQSCLRTTPLVLLSDQLFAAETMEPWFHVNLDMAAHCARIVEGSPIGR